VQGPKNRVIARDRVIRCSVLSRRVFVVLAVVMGPRLEVLVVEAVALWLPVLVVVALWRSRLAPNWQLQVLQVLPAGVALRVAPVAELVFPLHTDDRDTTRWA
jgi:hypothetical protein